MQAARFAGFDVGWLTKRTSLSTQLNFGTDGACYGTCTTASCWDSPIDHGWAPSQMYAVYYGWPGANSYPQIYDRNWPAYYQDLNQAAASAGKAQIPYTGVMWGCGTGGDERRPVRSSRRPAPADSLRRSAQFVRQSASTAVAAPCLAHW